VENGHCVVRAHITFDQWSSSLNRRIAKNWSPPVDADEPARRIPTKETQMRRLTAAIAIQSLTGAK
jgi:hypothetical protein